VNQELARRETAVERAGQAPVPRISPDIVRPRLPELGRIRLGEKDAKKGYPKKLDAFRFTSRDVKLMEAVAERFGGKVQDWMSDEGPQWQVYSTAVSLDVVVPRAELAFSQWFENWDGAVCRRRCDGHVETVSGSQCLCNPDDRACLPTTRLNVMLPDIPGMGVWRVESHGFNAAAEILGTIELAAASGASLLPATLMLAQRTKRRLNKSTGKAETNRFVVPVLVINVSLREMVAEQDQIRRRALGLASMPERADEGRMRALRTAVFTRWPESVDEPERSRRLAQLSEMLGRPVHTISAEHDLTMQEAILLADTVDSLPNDVDTLPAGDWAEDTQREGVVPGVENAGPVSEVELGEVPATSAIPAQGELTTPPGSAEPLPLTTERLVAPSPADLSAMYNQDMATDRANLRAQKVKPEDSLRAQWVRACKEVGEARTPPDPDGPWSTFPGGLKEEERMVLAAAREQFSAP
jgi:hypothetical protein